MTGKPILMIYVVSSKNVYAAKRLESEARSKKYEVRIMDMEDLIACDFKLPINQGDVLYIRNPYLNGRPEYIPQIIKLAKSFKAKGGRVVDANIARGDLGKGKWADYKKLKRAGLPIPHTQKSEIPASPAGRRNPKFETNLKPKIPNPKSYVLKWIFGLKAKGTFLISSDKDIKRIPSYIPKKELMVQEYIEADYEYKVITVGYKALPVILRFKFNKKLGRVDFGSYSVIASASEAIYQKGLPRPSAAPPSSAGGLGARNDKLRDLIHVAERASKTLGRELASIPFLPLEGGGEEGVKKVISIAEKASRALGRELAKVDILEKAGKFYILEVNRFPGLESFESLTKYNVFSEFIDYLKYAIIKP